MGCQRVLEYAQNKLEQMKQDEINIGKKRDEASEDQLDITKLLALAEASSQKLESASEPLLGDVKMKEAEILELSLEVEKVGMAALRACARARKALSEKGDANANADDGAAEDSDSVASIEARLQAVVHQVAASLSYAARGSTTKTRKK